MYSHISNIIKFGLPNHGLYIFFWSLKGFVFENAILWFFTGTSLLVLKYWVTTRETEKFFDNHKVLLFARSRVKNVGCVKFYEIFSFHSESINLTFWTQTVEKVCLREPQGFNLIEYFEVLKELIKVFMTLVSNKYLKDLLTKLFCRFFEKYTAITIQIILVARYRTANSNLTYNNGWVSKRFKWS